MNDKLKKLEDKNKLYKKILKTLPDYFAFKNAKGVYEIVSHEVDSIYKDKFPTIEGKSIYQIYSQEEVKDVLALDQEVIKKGSTVQSVLDTKTDKGSVTLDSIRTPIYDDDGELLGIVSMSRDISELVHVTERLEEISRLQKIIIEIGKTFVNLSKDNFDDIMNASLRDLGTAINADRAYVFEYNFSENTMENTHEWCNKGIKKEIDNLKGIPITYYLEGWVNHHLEKETVLIKDMELEDPDAKLTKVLKPQGIKTCITIPFFIEEECAGFIGFDAVKEKRPWDDLVDIFSILPEMYSSLILQHRIQKELRDAQEKAREASMIQSDFIAKVTHELRTPINGLSNALYLIQDSGLDKDQQQYTEIMEYSLEVLSGMVNNILDYSKIEKNKLIFKSSEISLENEIIKLIKVNKYMANSKGLGLYLNYDYSIPSIISADTEKLRQILNNLIVNAIKYTNYGHVEIKVSKLVSDGPYIDVRFEIIDTGIGITREDQNKIFDEFFQVGDTLNKKPQGTGLGLTITREFLHFLKSELYVDSELREGSVFSFDLKFYSPSVETIQSLDQSALVVDLSEGKHSNIINFLETHFAQVGTCNIRNCRLAIREPYDVVFVYTNDKKTFKESFSQIEKVLMKVKDRMKKILIFDDVKNQTYVDALEVFDNYIEFPTSSEVLLDTLTSDISEEVIKEVKKEDEKPKKQHILLVDDNNINRRVMSELLKGMYLEVTEAKDGFEAIEKVKEHNFNMIFMDILMPGMDGYETSKKIRELDGVSGSIPIIAVTANDTEETKEKIVEFGMNGVLPKPLRKDNLEELLSEYFNTIINEVDEEEDLLIFDKNEFELFYEEDYLRQEIINTFFADKKEDLDRIISAFKSKNCETIHKALHYMKSSFAYLKATKILKITQQILDLTDENKLNDVLLLEEPLLHNYDLLLKTLSDYYETL